MHHSWSELEDTSPWSQSWEHCLCVWISASPLSLISVVFPASCSVRNFADAYLDSSSRYPEKVLTQTLKKTKFWLFLIHSQRQTLLSQPSATPGSILNFIHNFTICLCVQNKEEKAAFTLLIVFEEDFLDWMKSGDELSFCFYTKWDFWAETERRASQEEFPSLWHLDSIGNYYLDSCEGYEVGTVCIYPVFGHSRQA